MCDKSEHNVILDNIPASEVPHDLIKSEETKDPTETEKKITEESKQNADFFKNSFEKMDNKFIEYLEVFTKAIDNSEALKTSLKKRFFWVIMGILIVIIFTLCLISVMAVIFGTNDAKTVVAIGGMLIEGMAALLFLPKIIAEYLFNKEEEKHRMEIIQSMQNYNDHKKEQDK